MRATDLAQLLQSQRLKAGDWAVDATVGNGHDTLFLAESVGPSGRVFGFDVQEAALNAAAERVRAFGTVELFHSGHEHMLDQLPPEAPGRLAAVMFNLGYLPGSDKTVTTQTDTALAGLEQALACLKVGGLVTLVLYFGHPGGAEEAAAMISFAHGLPGDFAALHHRRVNSARPAPELLAIERCR